MWVLVYRVEREDTGPHVVECYRRKGEGITEPGIMVSLDLRRKPEERWNWARTYYDERGLPRIVKGRARSRPEAFRLAREVHP